VERWRLILDAAGHGVWNMGVDEALLASAISGGPATLRLYGWQGPWLSLGYAQPWDAGRAQRCARAGVGIVRRVTGGRAVLHGADLTYAIAASEDALPAGLEGSYRLVCEALLCALRSLGVPAAAQESSSQATSDGFDCFAAPAALEVCVRGRKLAGSAQRRARGAILQHGSIRLAQDPLTARQAAGLVGPGATSLAEEGVCLSLEGAAAACTDAFAAVLGARLEPGQITSVERDRALARRGRSPLVPGTRQQGPHTSAR
jgi:lipoate-protein ligase A